MIYCRPLADGLKFFTNIYKIWYIIVKLLINLAILNKISRNYTLKCEIFYL